MIDNIKLSELRWAVEMELIAIFDVESLIHEWMECLKHRNKYCIDNSKNDQVSDESRVLFTKIFIRKSLDEMGDVNDVFDIIDRAYVRGGYPQFLSPFVGYMPLDKHTKYSNDPNVLISRIKEVISS